MTTTEGHMRLERARERVFAQFAEEAGVLESPRKRHRPEGEGEQPLAPPASTAVESGVRSNHQEGGCTSSGSPLLASVPLAKRSLEQETDMTHASVEQGERKRCKEHPTVPESADCSSSSESSRETHMGLVDVCTILSEIPETEGCRRGGPVTPDLTMLDFTEADCRTKCQKF